jgi:hypothetical protein
MKKSRSIDLLFFVGRQRLNSVIPSESRGIVQNVDIRARHGLMDSSLVLGRRPGGDFMTRSE